MFWLQLKNRNTVIQSITLSLSQSKNILVVICSDGSLSKKFTLSMSQSFFEKNIGI